MRQVPRVMTQEVVRQVPVTTVQQVQAAPQYVQQAAPMTTVMQQPTMVQQPIMMQQPTMVQQPTMMQQAPTMMQQPTMGGG